MFDKPPKRVKAAFRFNFQINVFFSPKCLLDSGDCAVSLSDDSSPPFHKDSIRAIRYGANGKLFVSAGDDKVVKIWSAESWKCISAV